MRDVMTANAEAGYWNGATPPSGYETAIAAVLRNGDPAFRRAWLHLFVDRVVVGPNEIRILGPK